MEKLEHKKKYRLKSQVITIVFCVVCLALGLGVGIKIGKPNINENAESNIVMNEIVSILEDNWIDTTESDYSMQTRMINGLVSNLGDPYTSYMSIEQYNDFVSTINGDFVGIGVGFVQCDDGGMITNVYKGTPAYEAGLKKGDIIHIVDKASVAGLDANGIKEKVVGEANSSVEIVALRDNKELTFNIVRKAVEIDIEYEITDSFGYLNIITFVDNTAKKVEDILKEFEKNSVENIVVDVRNNTGGYLNAVEDILNLFIPNNKVMFKMQNANGEIQEYKADNSKVYDFNKGYILMNGESASSSEVLIGALTEVLNYKTIGTKSYGKGIAQTNTTLSNGCTLKYTYAKWLTPSGKCIHNDGFTPNVEVIEEYFGNYRYYEFEDEQYAYDSVATNVIVMQKSLKRLGYNVDREDGYFSTSTKNALIAYQQSIGLQPTGIYDLNTAQKLYASVSSVVLNSEDLVLNKVIEILN